MAIIAVNPGSYICKLGSKGYIEIKKPNPLIENLVFTPPIAFQPVLTGQSFRVDRLMAWVFLGRKRADQQLYTKKVPDKDVLVQGKTTQLIHTSNIACGPTTECFYSEISKTFGSWAD